MQFTFRNRICRGRSPTRIMFVLSALVMTGSAGAATVCRVTVNGTGGGDGSNWNAQAMTLKSALSTTTCDEIWVKAGTYTPSAGTNRSASFTINRSVKIYGGFAGTENQRDARNPADHLTVLSGDLKGNDGADFARNGDNSYHVVRVDGSNQNGSGNAITASTVLDGFTISGGNANNYSAGDEGGGLYCDASYLGNCSPTISHVIFSSNNAGSNGGAVYCDSYKGVSNPAFTNVTFSGNQAVAGGAVYSIAGNGGTASPTFNKVTFNGNTAETGGAVKIGVSSADNTASNASFNNVTFADNFGRFDGGAAYNQAWGGNSSQTFNNVTFSGNTTLLDASGAVYNLSYDGGSAHVVMRNTISWGNGDLAIFNKNTATSKLYDSVQQGNCPSGSTCSGNMIRANPLLGPLQDNGGPTQTMLPGVGSPAINAGKNNTCKDTDQRGVTRPQQGQCDIGAVEFMDLIFADGFEL